MRLSRCSALLALLAVGCGEASAPDASSDDAREALDGPSADAVVLDDLVLMADADPLERLDCASEPAEAGTVRAKHVVCDEELIAGALAMGRVGDVVIENAHTRFVIRAGEGSASTIGGPAGALIDAAPMGGLDLLKEVFPLFDLVSLRPESITVVDGGSGGEARVRVLFEDAPLELVETVAPGVARPSNVRGRIDYVLAPDERTLRIEIDVTTREGDASTFTRPGFLALLGGGQEEVQPGVGVLDGDRFGGPGTRLVGERSDGAIAIELLDAPEGSSTRIETIHLVRGSRVVVGRGALTRFELRVAVADVAASALDALSRSDEGAMPLVVRGVAGDRFEITRDDAVIVRSRIPTSGEVSIALPVGAYTIRAGFDGTFVDPPSAFTHDGTAPVELAGAPRAILRVSADVDGDGAAPVRVTVERDGEELARFIAMGPTDRAFTAGPARVTISHGLEHDVVVEDVTLVSGETLAVAAPIARAIDTSGWVSADLHLHSELSTDSTHRVEDALRMMAAENVEVVSSTDHDFVNDHARHATRAGVEGRVLLVSGEEVSTTVFGHVNGYPLRADLALSAAGAVAWFDRSPREIFDGLRARGDADLGGALVQINHPRLDDGFFDAIGLDPETGHATAMPATLELPAETDLDDFAFDVIEVWNGYTRGDNEETFADYLALCDAGRVFTMVGNSDTHRPTLPAGSPRSFVRVPDDASGAFGWSDVDRALRAREVTVAGGIFVTAEIVGPRAGGSVPVRVRVQAAPWVEVDRLRVYAGRGVVIDRPIAASSVAVRLEETIDVPIAGEAFVVVRADGTRAPEPVQHFAPYGVTNALFVP